MNLVIKTLTNYLYQQLTEFPFHNLSLLNRKNASIGGTCFDHALKLKQTLQVDGFNAGLHEAEVCLTGEKSHRLVRVDVEGNTIFLDTGTGWPTAYAIRLERVVRSYKLADIQFKVIPYKKHILIQRFNGNHWQNMNRIPIEKQEESIILDKFNNRYTQELPFSNELRLCWLEGRMFNRIVGNQFYTYEHAECVKQVTVTPVHILKRVEKTVFPELVDDLELFMKGYN